MANMDLDLKLSGNSVAGYEVEAIGASVQRTNPQPLRLPVNIMAEIQQARISHSRILNRKLGQELFSALFPEPIRDIWFHCKGRNNTGVVRVRLDIRSHELEKIPWELLHDGDSSLSLSEKLSIIRILHDGRGFVSPAVTTPLKVLLATATPSDATPLPGVALEARQLRETLRLASSSQVAKVEVVEHVTLKKLEAVLTDEFNVLHFMGHGAFHHNQGFLLLENEVGRAHWCEAETFGDLLRNRHIQLLTLTACETAVPSSDDSLIGVAHAAHYAGVPAVVAMQQPVLDRAALEFAVAFFRKLIQRGSLEIGMTAGRLAIKQVLGNDRLEWSTPVLFSSLALPQHQQPSPNPEGITVIDSPGTIIARNVGSIRKVRKDDRA